MSGVTPEMDAAYDILHDAGYSPDKIAEVITGCLRTGRNPERIARKMVALKRAVTG